MKICTTTVAAEMTRNIIHHERQTRGNAEARRHHNKKNNGVHAVRVEDVQKTIVDVHAVAAELSAIQRNQKSMATTRTRNNGESAIRRSKPH